MHILFISSLYPPYVMGGWEQLTRDINNQLQERGHHTHVLTSTYGVGMPMKETGISRLLSLESDLYHYRPLDFLGHKRRLRNNLRHVEKTINCFDPEVVFVHSMYNLSRSVPWMAEQRLPGRVVYYVASDWPYASDLHSAFWHAPARTPIRRLAKRILAPIPMNMIKRENWKFSLRFERVVCVSQAVKDMLSRHAGIDSLAMCVIYNGVETDLFMPLCSNSRDPQNGLRLLFAGMFVPHKGVHTALEAMAILIRDNGIKDVSLTMVGSGRPDYHASLREFVTHEGLSEHIHFLDSVPREKMPDIMQKHDILIFPSIGDEGLPRVMQEAMASGMVVVGTVTGGSSELLVEGETGLTFPPGNASILANRIEELRQNPGLMPRLAKEGRAVVADKFDLRRMIDKIEAYLVQVIKSSVSS
jgi:glycogen synthase